MELQDYRKEIDRIDRALVELFCQRMTVCAGVAAWKQERNLPVLDQSREDAKLAVIAQMAGPEMAPYCQELYRTIFAQSRAYQQRLMEK